MRNSNAARVFPARFNGPTENTACVYRMLFGKKYFIWKGKYLHQSVRNFGKDLDRKMRNGYPPDDIQALVLDHIKRSRVTICTVEVILCSEDPKELLAAEKKELELAAGDMDCLNQPGLPQLVPAWMNEPAENKPLRETIVIPADIPTPKEEKQAPAPRQKKPAAKNPPVVPPVTAVDPDQVDLDDIKNLLSSLHGKTKNP